MSERTLVTFSCGYCGRGGFTVVDRNPPIPMEVVEVYDRDHEGEACTQCKTCGTELPEFKVGEAIRALYAEVNAARREDR